MTASRDFPKHFAYEEAEPKLYQMWESAGAFGARPEKAEPYVIVIPPPNITGRLHMGHALNNTIQDVLIRQKRMDGFDAIWIPGTDHAGIATQTVVKKQLSAKGVDLKTLTRAKLVEEIWKWREEFGDAILEQLRKMGCSCDWSRLRFTMDEGLSKAVRECFVRLYNDGLIYRGKRIVNWCPIDQTALSDDEVDKSDEKGKMYHIRYPFEDNAEEYLVVATTRPETLFGDVAVAIHPKNEKLGHHIGKKVRLPLQGRIIPVIADDWADPEKGTGCVKITPAHDPNDFEVGERHNLERINVMNTDATMNEVVPEAYRGLSREACRKKAIEDLDAQGLLDKVEPHTLAIGRSYRSKAIIEFRLSDQWFVKMEPLADQALKASGFEKVEGDWQKTSEGDIKLYPERVEKIYKHWLTNIRDWCISRQIWWGHQIPAWFHNETGEVLVGTETPQRVKDEPGQWKQDEDVLDTWFSSWLWPMSTLGWPDKTPDFERYYPTSVLSTAQDILFFWVARMNFAGLYFENKLPYRDVYIHSVLADLEGKKMSKSLGNGIDPLVVIEGGDQEALKRPVMEARPTDMKKRLVKIEKLYPNGYTVKGADAMRWTLIYSITEGDFVRLSLDRFTEGRNFITKLWNGAGRVITALQAETTSAQDETAPPTDEDQWLLARLDSTIRACRKNLDSYDFGEMAQGLYHFVWDDFCSWALELAKTRLTSDDARVRRGALSVMGSVLADMIRLLHPIIPFVTEELFGRLVPSMDKLGLWLDKGPDAKMLILDRYPHPRAEPNLDIESRFAILQRFVIAVRQIRASSNIKDNVKVTVQVKALLDETRPMLEQAKAAACFLGKMENIEFVEQRDKGTVAEYDRAFELYLDLKRYVDLDDYLERLNRQLTTAQNNLEGTESKLANPSFVDRAPPERVAQTRAKKAELGSLIEKLSKLLAELTA